MTFDWTQIKSFGFSPRSSFNPKPPPRTAEKIYLGETISSPGMIKAVLINGTKFEKHEFSQITKVITDPLLLKNSKNLNLIFENGDLYFIELNGIFKEREFNILKNWIANTPEKLVKIANDYENETHRRSFYNFLYDIVALVKALENVPLEYHKILIETVNAGDRLMHNRVLAEVTNNLINHHIVKIESDLKLWEKKPDLIIDGIKSDVKTILPRPLDEDGTTNDVTNDLESLSDFAYKVTKDIINPEIKKKQIGEDGIFFIAPWSQIINSFLYIFFHQMKLEGKHTFSQVKFYSKLPPIKKGQTVLVLTSHKAFENGFLIFDTRWVNLILEDFAQQGYPKINLYDSMAYLTSSIIREGCPLGATGIDLSFFFHIR